MTTESDSVPLLQRAREAYDAKRYAEASQLIRRLIAENPAHFQASGILGHCHLRLGNRGAGAREFVKHAQVRPGDPIAHFWRGASDYAEDNVASALQHTRRALALDPALSSAAHNLANMVARGGASLGTVRAYEQARILGHDSDGFALDFGRLLLALGRWEEGWPLYERRLHTRRFALAPTRHDPPLWDGSPQLEATCLIWNEANVGDEIQFAQLLTEAQSLFRHIIFECDPRLETLFRRSFPRVEVVARTDRPEFSITPDVQCTSSALAMHLRRKDEDFKDQGIYLKADPTRVERYRTRWRDRFGERPIIGISWRSANMRFTSKTAALPLWQDVLKCQDAVILSLQYGEIDSDLASLQASTGQGVETDPEIDPLNDLDGFAAQLMAVDLVISISNSTVHQASALGRPAWCLLSRIPDWRWMASGDLCPWYPRLRLYRQDERREWAPVLAQVAHDLTPAIERWQTSGSFEGRLLA